MRIQYIKGLDEFQEARRLLAAGEISPNEKFEFCRGEMVCLTGSAKWFAEHTVKETSTEGPIFVRYRPFPPRGVVRRALSS